MFTQWRRSILSLTVLGLLLGACVLCNQSWRAAHAQADDFAVTQAAQEKKEDPDREAIAKAVQSFAAAFEKGDARAVAAHWTENGEYNAADGTVFRGRAAIEKVYSELFAKSKTAAKVDIEVDSVRFPSRDTAIEEGHFKLRLGKEPAVTSKYSVLHVRENGKWLMAVVRDWPGEGATLAISIG